MIKMDCNNNDGSNLLYQMPHNGINSLNNGMSMMNNSATSLGQNPIQNHSMCYDKKQYEMNSNNNSVYLNGHSLTPPVNNIPTNQPTNGSQYIQVNPANNTSPHNHINQYPDYCQNNYNNNSNYYSYDRNLQYNQMQQNQIKQEQPSQQINYMPPIEDSSTNGTNQVYNSIQNNGVHHHPQTTVQQQLPTQSTQHNSRPQQHYQTNFSPHISSNNPYNSSNNNNSPNNNYPMNYDQNYYNYNNQQWRYQQPPPQQPVNSNQPQINIVHHNPQVRNLMHQPAQQANQHQLNPSLPSQPYSNMHPNNINQQQPLPNSQNINHTNHMNVNNNYCYRPSQPVDPAINHVHHQNYMQSPPQPNQQNISQNHQPIPTHMQQHPYNPTPTNHHSIQQQQIPTSVNSRHPPIQHSHPSLNKVAKTPSPGSSIEAQLNPVVEKISLSSITKRRRGKGKTTREKPQKESKKVSAYGLFFKKKQAEIKNQIPNMSFGEISKTVAQQWEALPEEEKKEFKIITEITKKTRLEELAKEKVSLVLEVNNMNIKQEK